MITNKWNHLPVWVSTLTKEEEAQQKSNGAGLYAQKLHVNKISYFNKRNYQSGQTTSTQQKVSRLYIPRNYQKSRDY